MPYKPYLIAGFKTGKSIGVEPWRTIPGAFPTLENMRVIKEVLEKRLGFTPFATMKHGSTPQTTTSIVGIHPFLKRGMPKLIICDTLRPNLYYNALPTTTMTDISGGSDIFSGSSSDFFHFANWLKKLYMVNNKDQIYEYTGSGDVSGLDIPLDTGEEGNQVQTCRFIFIKDDHMILLDPVVRGDWTPGLMLYSKVLTTDFRSAGSGTDTAETQERVAAAGQVGKNIAVFFQGPYGGSLWQIKSTRNSLIPFNWDKFSSIEGSRSPYSGVEFNNGLGVVGLDNLVFFDGHEIRYFDLPHLRDILTSEFSKTYIRSVTGHNQKEKKFLLFSFAAAGASGINRILEYNLIDKSATIHKSEQSFFLNCFGGFNDQKVPQARHLDDVIDQDGLTNIEMTVDSRAILGNPYPFTLIGGNNSQVYRWNDDHYDGTENDSGKIAMKAISARLNPFIEDGKKAWLGKMLLYVDNDANASFNMKFYKDTATSPYKTVAVSCDLSNGKDFVMVEAGAVGNFHRWEISHTERDNQPRIHAFMPFFKRGGPLYL